MSVFDVRNSITSAITMIRFADDRNDLCEDQASYIMRGASHDVIDIFEGENEDFIRVRSRDHAELLIQAIEKAIDLGWVK